MLTATSLWAGECEKNTAREAVVCLEQKLAEVTEKLNQQTEVISRLEKALDVKVTTKAVNRPSNYVVEAPDYNAEFKKCEKVSHKKVDCTFFITNNLGEHKISFVARNSQVVLKSGKTLSGSIMKIGPIQTRSAGSWGYYSFPSGVPLNGVVSFTNFDEQSASLFRVGIEGKDGLRNIDFKQVSLF